jgi:hypothetical protein
MSKKAMRFAAILVSLCFLLALAPVVNSAEKTPVKTTSSFLSLLKKPLFLLSSLFHFYPPVVDESVVDNTSQEIGQSNISNSIVKTTEDGTVTPPIKRD